MPENIPAPPSAPRSTNLRTSVRLVSDGLRWENGISFLPEECAPGGSVDPFCADPETPKAAGESPDVVTWMPYGIYSYTSCPYVPNEDTFAELQAKALRTLEAQTSHLVEQIFWNGVVDGIDFTTAHPGNRPLVAAPITSNGGTPISAMREMDSLLSTALGGRMGMVHVPARLLNDLAYWQLIRRNGNIWETVTGNIVVPGTGYTGTDPDGEVDPDGIWIYGTSMVELRLGGPMAVPGTIGDAIDRATNELVARAERLALAYWDLCAHVGVRVCWSDPGVCESES